MQFEDLEIWKVTENLILDVYKNFKWIKDFGFKDQLQRASISIANNISEWYERQTIKEKQRFLRIAKWSCWEVRNMLHFWSKLWYISQKEYSELYVQCISVSKMIYSFIRKIK